MQGVCILVTQLSANSSSSSLFPSLSLTPTMMQCIGVDSIRLQTKDNNNSNKQKKKEQLQLKMHDYLISQTLDVAAAKYLRMHNFIHPIVSKADALGEKTKHNLKAY